MKCPDCGSDIKKHGAYYTCNRCGLSLKPWEIEKAHERAKKEIEQLQAQSTQDKLEQKKRDRRRYRNWYEGRKDIDD